MTSRTRGRCAVPVESRASPSRRGPHLRETGPGCQEAWCGSPFRSRNGLPVREVQVCPGPEASEDRGRPPAPWSSAGSRAATCHGGAGLTRGPAAAGPPARHPLPRPRAAREKTGMRKPIVRTRGDRAGATDIVDRRHDRQEHASLVPRAQREKAWCGRSRSSGRPQARWVIVVPRRDYVASQR